MKLRFFEDDFMQWQILDHPKISNEAMFPGRLRNLIKFLFENYEIPNRFKIILIQTSEERSSLPNNILHFCEYTAFIMNKKIRPEMILFKFRDTIDLTTGSAIWRLNYPERLEYYEHHSGDRDATEYFKNVCKDRQLADFLLAIRNPIQY